MYYPYIRGKQFDLFALKALLEQGRLSRKIAPIIDPVKNSKTLEKLLLLLQQKQHPYFLIENPQAGDFITETGLNYLREVNAPKARILEHPIELYDDSPDLWIVSNSFPVLQSSDWQDKTTPVVAPLEFRLLKKINGPKIFAVDSFTRLPKNSYYLEFPDELFSDAHLTYKRKKTIGFSDFSIDSAIYYEHSYPSQTLVLHWIYFDAMQKLRIHHFASKEAVDQTQGSQFQKIMEKLLQTDFLKETQGLIILKEAYEANHFPGMGILRKASVMNHLELISAYFEQQNE